MKMFYKLLLLLLILIAVPAVRANDVYISQAGGGIGSSCGSTLAVSYFNTLGNWTSSTPTGTQIGPGTHVHACGTFTGSSGSTMFTFQGSGSSGLLITLMGETGNQLNAPYWNALTAAVNTNGKTFVSVTGLNIANTANGTSLANQQVTRGINAGSCSGCVISGNAIGPLYTRAAGDAKNGLDQTLTVGLFISGPNITVSSNNFTFCGWCVENFYNNGDSNITINLNTCADYDHCIVVAPLNANPLSASGFYIDGNQMGSTNAWDTPGCSYHHDGIHVFGSLSGGTIDNFFYSNNYHFGNWGTCPTGWVYIEGGSSNPSHVVNGYFWNNVGISPAGSIQNTNGWFGIFSITTSLLFVNNTAIGGNDALISMPWNIGSVANFTFKNNIEIGFGGKINLGTGTTSVNNNGYDTFCQAGNCYVYQGLFKGSFTNWKTALSSAFVSGADAAGIQSASPNVASDGTLNTGSPFIHAGADLSSLATGHLASLASGTTKGGTITAVPRGSSWDMGAYQTGGTSTRPNPPTSLTGSVT